MTIEKLDTAYGTMFVPDTDYAQGGWLRSTGRSAEDDHITEIIQLLGERPRGVVIDVGASFGTWTLALAPYATRVIAYEPHSDIFDLLYRSVVANGLGEEISVRNRPVWSHPAEVSIPDIDLGIRANFGGLSLKGFLEDQPGVGRIKINAVPLDGQVSGKVSFIKIDVEGSEPEVLRGAEKLISRWKPVMFVEVFHSLTDTNALTAQIEELGYGLLRRGPNVLALPL